MSFDIVKRYGTCKIHSGTYLFRIGEIRNDVLFFALHPDFAFSLYSSGNIQVWRTKVDIELLFMVKSLNVRGFPVSSVTDVFSSLTGKKELLDSVELKARDFDNRKVLTAGLKSKGINGWLTSIEDKPPLEVCLFPDNLSSCIELTNTLSIAAFSHYNALHRIQIIPSINFLNDLTALAFSTQFLWYSETSRKATNYSIIDKSIEEKWFAQPIIENILSKQVLID